MGLTMPVGNLDEYVDSFNTAQKDKIIKSYFDLEEKGILPADAILREVTKNFYSQDNVLNMSMVGIVFLKNRYKELVKA